jgi:hypothetical protein
MSTGITFDRLRDLLREEKGTHAAMFPVSVPRELLDYLLQCEAMVRCADLLAEPLAEVSRHRGPLSVGLCERREVPLLAGGPPVTLIGPDVVDGQT